MGFLKSTLAYLLRVTEYKNHRARFMMIRNVTCSRPFLFVIPSSVTPCFLFAARMKTVCRIAAVKESMPFMNKKIVYRDLSGVYLNDRIRNKLKDMTPKRANMTNSSSKDTANGELLVLSTTWLKSLIDIKACIIATQLRNSSALSSVSDSRIPSTLNDWKSDKSSSEI